MATHTARPLLALAVVLALMHLAPQRARACGGFFCQRVPVVQAGEQIVYAVGEDGTLTMSVRIYYEGAAPEFAWILPVPEVPRIELGATALFDGLDGATQPQFWISRSTVEGTCRREPDCEFAPTTYYDGAGIFLSDASAPASSDAATGPTIYSRGTLGPYETVVIGGASATEIHEWLTANGYDLPASSIPLLDTYVTTDHRFVALRLRNDATVAEIQPITLRFGNVPPCLPIRLTAIATQPDLPITAFFLARTRATPRNYSLIEADYPAGLFLGTIQYTSWVSNTADDMGGQAFIADYAGATPALSLELPSVTDLATSMSPEELVRELQSRGYMGDSQLLALLTRFIQPPADREPTDYINCLARSFGGECGEPMSFDPAGLVAAIDEAITTPRARAQVLVTRHPYTTRLFTTMSAEEMTVDPEFVLDDGLGDVANLHEATAVTECDASHFQDDARQRLDLPSGASVELRPARPSGTDEQRCASRGGWLRGTDAAIVGPDASFDAGPLSVAGGGGCSATSTRGTSPPALAWVAMLALAVLGRARGRRAAPSAAHPTA